MSTMGFAGTYIMSLVEQKMDSTQLKGESQVERVSKGFPLGRWELSRSLQYAPPIIDRSVGRSCSSESRGKQHFRAMDDECDFIC
jgi:hypothetical protein